MLILPVNPDKIDEFLQKNLISKNSIRNEKKNYQIEGKTKSYYLDPLTKLPIDLYKFKIIFCFDTNMFYTKDSFRKLYSSKFRNKQLKLTPDNSERLSIRSGESENRDIEKYIRNIPQILSNIKFSKENFEKYIRNEIDKFKIVSQKEKDEIFNKYIQKFGEINTNIVDEKEEMCMICYDYIKTEEETVKCLSEHKFHKNCLDSYYKVNDNKGCFLCLKDWNEYIPPTKTKTKIEFEEDEVENLEMNLEAVGEVHPDNQLQFIDNYNLKGVINTIVFCVLNYMIQDFIETAPFGTMKIKIFLSFIAQMIIVYYIMQNRKELF